MKTCSRCKESKDESEFYYLNRAKNKLRSECKFCTRLSNVDYYDKNSVSIQEHNKLYAENNKDRLSAYKKQWAEENKDRLKLMEKKRREINREEKLEKKRQYYEQHKQELAKKGKIYREKNKEKLKERSAEYRARNKEVLSERKKTYAAENREVVLKKKSAYYDSICVSEKMCSELPITDNAEIIKGLVTVECKMCGKRFNPTTRQVSTRLKAFRGVTPGEANFYCSEDCKSACPIYKHQPKHVDPRISFSKRRKNKARSCKHQGLKQLQCDEKGYNYCERCGDIIDVELHHTLPVAEFAEEAISSASHILLCAGCHTDLHHSC